MFSTLIVHLFDGIFPAPTLGLKAFQLDDVAPAEIWILILIFLKILFECFARNVNELFWIESDKASPHSDLEGGTKGLAEWVELGFNPRRRDAVTDRPFVGQLIYEQAKRI